MLLADDLDQLLKILPEFISFSVKHSPYPDQLLEIVLDIGRRPEARFSNGSKYLSYRTIVWQDLDYILKRLGKFSGDNRAGIEKTLHRISSLRNRQGSVIGLTCRIGRAFFGTVSIIRDLLETRRSILLLGRPGVGKTTAIREIARVLSDSMKKRVIIIDTSNEIAGDGDLPHPSIGKARRMQVSSPQNQHQVMIEAVENHMPEVIIIDEIGTELEAVAARTIAERGVQLVGTAHGTTLENLIKNPTITDLIGGIQYVTLGDEEAKRRGSSKSILERKAPPTFNVAIELHDAKTWIIHENIEHSVDLLLQGQRLQLQERKVNVMKTRVVDCDFISSKFEENRNLDEYDRERSFTRKHKFSSIVSRLEPSNSWKEKNRLPDFSSNKETQFDIVFLYVYGVNNQDLQSLIKTLKIPIRLTKEIQSANAILALASLLKGNKKLRQLSYSKKINIYTIPNNSLLQIAKALKDIVDSISKSSLHYSRGFSGYKPVSQIIAKELLTPLEETRLSVEEIVIPKKQIIDLLPRASSIRRLQHELVLHYHLKSVSVGKEPNKRLRIYPKSFFV